MKIKIVAVVAAVMLVMGNFNDASVAASEPDEVRPGYGVGGSYTSGVLCYVANTGPYESMVCAFNITATDGFRGVARWECQDGTTTSATYIANTSGGSKSFGTPLSSDAQSYTLIGDGPFTDVKMGPTCAYWIRAAAGNLGYFRLNSAQLGLWWELEFAPSNPLPTPTPSSWWNCPMPSGVYGPPVPVASPSAGCVPAEGTGTPYPSDEPPGPESCPVTPDSQPTSVGKFYCAEDVAGGGTVPDASEGVSFVIPDPLPEGMIIWMYTHSSSASDGLRLAASCDTFSASGIIEVEDNQVRTSSGTNSGVAFSSGDWIFATFRLEDLEAGNQWQAGTLDADACDSGETFQIGTHWANTGTYTVVVDWLHDDDASEEKCAGAALVCEDSAEYTPPGASPTPSPTPSPSDPPPPDGDGNLPPPPDVCAENPNAAMCKPVAPVDICPDDAGPTPGIAACVTVEPGDDWDGDSGPDPSGGEGAAGGAGGFQGGRGECEAEYPKIGQADMDLVTPGIQLLEEPDISFPGSINPVDYIHWVARLVIWLPVKLGNVFFFLYNSFIDVIMPDVTCLVEMFTDFGDTLDDHIPFSYVIDAGAALTNVLNSPSSDAIELPTDVTLMGHTVALGGVFTAVTAWVVPYRGIFTSLLYFYAAWWLFSFALEFFRGRNENAQQLPLIWK